MFPSPEGGYSRKKPKTLSGIETNTSAADFRGEMAGKNLKPYQGLKPHHRRQRELSSFAGKNLKPYQGLKQRIEYQKVYLTLPEKT